MFFDNILELFLRVMQGFVSLIPRQQAEFAAHDQCFLDDASWWALPV